MGLRGEAVYEYTWLGLMAIVLLAFFAALSYYSFLRGIDPVSHAEPLVEAVAEELRPGVVEVEPGVYEVTIEARQFAFIPSRIELRDPEVVRFKVYSADVIHGFQIVGTNVNAMVMPGYVASFTWEPPEELEGRLLIICNEYCGVGHHLMMGELVIVRGGESG